ncbi:rho GTPase-activating protein 12 isoform X4 [Clarias gariepinus]|uniref:rho GTPase-activating protein 12 isoform X4 n=1 Tax=Clarias gariepinus TaxID=13013 RepID=UPI00234DD8A7|nr:rho GTPase-activating protein 12 isoform X4 [Clarias gariepinus]
MSLPQEVLVNFQYEYTTRDGRNVSIKPNERYVLVARTNDHWWHVRKDEATKPFFIPAQYVTVLPSENKTSQCSSEQEGQDTPEPYSDILPPVYLDTSIEDEKSIDTANEKDEQFVFELDISQDVLTNTFPLVEGESSYAVSQSHIPTTDLQSTVTEPSENPYNDLNDDIKMLIRAGWDPKIWDFKEQNMYTSVDPVKDLTPQGSKDNKEDIEMPTVSPVTPSSTSASFSSQQSPVSPTNMPCVFTDKVKDDDLTAVYVNLPRSRQKSVSSFLSPSAWGISEPAELQDTLGSEGWETHTDEESGKEYYYHPSTGRSTWDYPLSPSMDSEPPLPEEDYPADEDTPSPPGKGDSYSFAGSSEYSLAHVKKAVIPRACLDRSAPAGWTLSVDSDGVWIFTNDHTQEQWIKSLDDRGQTYYYQKDGSKSEWNLPDLSASLRQCQVGNGGSWRNSTGSQDEKLPFVHRRNASDSDMSGSVEMLHNVSNLEKAGILNKTKISENGKKVRKNWTLSWTVLHGGVLTFHKDPKSTPSGTSRQTNHIVTEFTVDLKGATIGWAAKEKSSKKNVMELKTRAGTEFLIQYDTESIITDWHKVITDTIRQLDVEQHHSEDDEEASEKSSSTEKEDKSNVDKRRMSNGNIVGRQLSSSSTADSDPKKVRNKLRKFLLKRPTLQSVKEKGYIRENVFGCHLQNLCDQERTTVPSFVMKCIRNVEKRGLGVDGIYRVSGNLAVIQKLRFKADHEDLDLDEGHWDIHVISGALKLFFRELQEPLFPYSHFNSFVQGIKIPDYNSRVTYIRDLVKSLPSYNRDTMEALFSHLRKVIEHGDENRMTLQNVAIVFGPTLLKPEMESANITAYMVFQNQIIEFILSEFETIFHT